MNLQEQSSLLQTLADEREIHRTLLMYCRGSDRKDFELMRAAYHDDAYDDHGPFAGNIDEYMKWARVHHEKFYQMMHVLGSPLIELDGDSAFVESHCLLLQHFKPLEGQGPEEAQRVDIACRYLDRFEKRAGVWKIAHRVVSYDWVERVGVGAEFSPFGIGDNFHVSSRSRDDLVYKVREFKRGMPR